VRTFDELEHPIGFVRELAALSGDSISFEFSKYQYRPRMIDDERRTYRVHAEELRGWIETTDGLLREEEDLAFHSRVYVKNERLRHIPMVDFKERPSSSDLGMICNVLRTFQIDKVVLYDSGRSAHLYGVALITHEEWLRFLGRILLFNLPNDREIIDTRWVGHRLMAGYGTLRWTKNNPHYLAMPRRIRTEEKWLDRPL